MYQQILVALDNSRWSDYAADLAIAVARATGARLTGCHVYAARLHDDRFRQLEPELPDRYQAEAELGRLRDVHDDLIGRGLGIISDAYLDVFAERCRQFDLPIGRKLLEGRNYEEIVRHVRESGYDLVALGAMGLGHVDRSSLGSVAERVSRLVECDVLVARSGVSDVGDLPLKSATIAVAIDGSAHSFAGLDAALTLGKATGSRVVGIAAYDPFFHRVAFRSLAGVLSASASQLFRFQEQETLHDEIIDEGLGEVYRAHLTRAQKIAAARGVELEVELLEGKTFDVIAGRVATLRPALLVVGRVGIHHGPGVTLGSTTENLLRAANCNVLIVNRGIERAAAEEAAAEASAKPVAGPEVRWSASAEQMLERVPSFARRMARKAIESFARERGIGEITPAVYEQARKKFGR